MSQKYTELSRRLKYIRLSIPVDFQQKPKSLYFVAKWKVTELMFVLLYCGSIVLKGLISDVQYKYFYCSIRHADFCVRETPQNIIHTQKAT